jgi:hypothetical protein
VYLVPLAASLLGLVVYFLKLRNGTVDAPARVVLFCSMLLSTLFLTQYPIAYLYYNLYMLPLIILPFLYGLDRVLKRKLTTAAARVAVFAGLLAALAGLYVVTRGLGQDLGAMAWQDPAVIERGTADVYAPRGEAERVLPVVEYLLRRPPSESFVAYDVYNIPFAFLARRRVVVDYGQQHMFDRFGDRDIRELTTLVREGNMGTVILGKKYLRHTPAETELFGSLAGRYAMALENDWYIIYQRAEN